MSRVSSKCLKHRARLPEFAHVYPVGALTVKLAGERLTEMAELARPAVGRRPGQRRHRRYPGAAARHAVRRYL